jgi:hypothetical protein
MDEKTSFIAIAGTALLIGVLINAIIGLAYAQSSSSSGGDNITGADSNMTSGSITSNPSDNSGSASTGGLLGNCGYSITPTSNCGTTGNGR